MFGIFKPKERSIESQQKNRLGAEPSGELENEIESVRKRVAVPTLWLFGKTGSGKSSIVRRLTGSMEATIGEGFRPETKFSRRYDFPDAEAPLLRFLDTRGLGEAYYDASEDIQAFQSSSHLLIVTVRMVDHALDCLIEPLKRLRESTPSRPVLLVLTCVHEASPESDLSCGPELELDATSEGYNRNQFSPQLNSLIDLKCKQFEGLYDRIAIIDFTHEDDGFANAGFGEVLLKRQVLEMLPQAYRQTWAAATSFKLVDKSELQRRSHWQILAASALAATASAVPIPWVNMPIVIGIQTRMVQKIAATYDQKVTSKHWFALTNVAGTQIAVRLAARELLKFIPFVGIAASIAASFAFTYALGKVADWYFSAHAQGATPSDEELRSMFAEQLTRGHQLWETSPK